MSQLRTSDPGCAWKCAPPLPRPDMSAPAFEGVVVNFGGESRACQMDDMRRTDVVQRYGSGVPTQVGLRIDEHGIPLPNQPFITSYLQTGRGVVGLSSNDAHLGFMPTADSVLFLRDQYVGGRGPDLPYRYYRR